MLYSPREAVCRQFKKAENKFLNYDSQIPIDAGDIIVWKGRRAEFHIVGRIKDFGINVPVEPSMIPGNGLYNSRSGVHMTFKAGGPSKGAAMHFKYAGSSRYTIQAFDTKVETLDEVQLASEIVRAVRDNRVVWEKSWIVVTSIWRAEACSQLIAGGNDAVASIVTATPGINVPFNIADTTIGVSIGHCSNLASQQIALAGAIPYFIGMKFRRRLGSVPHMVRYAS